MVYRKFHESKDHKVTVLKASGYKGIAREMSSEDFMTRLITICALNELYKDAFENRMIYDDFSIHSKAKCADDDEYNSTVGREICNVKADLKYHRKMYDRYSMIAWVLWEVSKKLTKYIEMHQEKIERLERDLDQYVK